MKIEEVKLCSFQNWYEKFKGISIKSFVLPLSEEFIKYILKDGIILPKSANVPSTVYCDDSDSSDEKENWEDSDMTEPEAPYFPDLDHKIEDAIKVLGGKVFPKLNWSSPKDASWIAFNNSCCCTSVSDIYLLLKSSDFILHDLTQPFDLCEDFVENPNASIISSTEESQQTFYLVLRKWIEIDTSGEFRCFVRNKKLIGICQRENSAFFDHIDKHAQEIVQDITAFFMKNIQSNFSLPNYVFDVYRKKKNHVILIDFNPFGIITDSLLFEWDELNLESETFEENEFPEFRCVVDNFGIQPRTLSNYAVPRDIVDIATGGDSSKLVDLMKLKVDEQNNASYNEESDHET